MYACHSCRGGRLLAICKCCCTLARICKCTEHLADETLNPKCLFFSDSGTLDARAPAYTRERGRGKAKEGDAAQGSTAQQPPGPTACVCHTLYNLCALKTASIDTHKCLTSTVCVHADYVF